MAVEAKRTLEEIEAEIAATKAELQDVHGTDTEVYARIVGYYRAVRNWNKGKRDEFNNRKLFVYDSDYQDSRGMNAQVLGRTTEKVEEKAAETKAAVANATSIRYEFFMRKTCPNCPPVKNYMATVEYEGTIIDVDTDDGLRQAASKGVFSAPTVIFYDQKNNEIGRGHNVEEVKAVLAPVAVVA